MCVSARITLEAAPAVDCFPAYVLVGEKGQIERGVALGPVVALLAGRVLQDLLKPPIQFASQKRTFGI